MMKKVTMLVFVLVLCITGIASAVGEPVCLVISPTDAVVDDQVTLSAYDALDNWVDMRDYTSIEIGFDGQAAAIVMFDADALEQILVNLLSNVEKYAGGGGKMEIASRQDANRTTITITDHGPGIPADQRDRIFQPFHRASDKIEGAAGIVVTRPTTCAIPHIDMKEMHGKVMNEIISYDLMDNEKYRRIEYLLSVMKETFGFDNVEMEESDIEAKKKEEPNGAKLANTN